MAVPASPGLAANDKSATSQDRANALVTGTLTAVGPGKAMPAWGPLNFMAYGVIAGALTIAASGTNAGAVVSVTNINVGDSVQSTLVPAGTTVKTSGGGTALTFAFPTQTWQCNLIKSAAITFPNGVPGGLTLSTLVGAAVSDPNGYFGSGVTVLGVGADGVSLLLSAAPTSLPTLNAPVPVEFALTANCLVAGVDSAATYSGAATPFGASVITLQVERSLDGGSTWVCANIGGSGQPAQFANPAAPINVSFAEPEAGALYRVNATAFSTLVTNTTCTYRWSATGQASTILSTPMM